MRSEVAAIACALAALGSCGGDSDPINPCLECDLMTEGCYGVEVCGDAGCEPVPSSCQPICGDPATCENGHACVQGLDVPVCSPDCESELCPERQECRGLSCRTVDCGFIWPCLDAEQICDPWGHACYPFDGACVSAGQCPAFGGALAGVGEIDCVDDRCRVLPVPLPFPRDFPPPSVAISTPEAFEVISDPGALEIEWGGAAGASIVLILASPALVSDQLMEHAIWGVSIPEGAARSARLDDGHAIIDGEFRDAAIELPVGRSLYVTVQLVNDGELVGVSELVAFVVGEPWPEPGEPCDEPGLAPSTCLNPEHVQGCHPLLEECARLCLSQADCLDLGSQYDCGEPRAGYRYCEASTNANDRSSSSSSTTPPNPRM